MSKFMNLKRETTLAFDFPETKLSSILSDLNLPNSDLVKNTSFEEKRLIFLVSFREFLKGNLLLEEFSDIAGSISMLFPLETKTSEQEDYEMMIYETADLSLYVRLNNEQLKNMFSGIMGGIWKYFNKHKHVLDNLPEKYSTPAYLEKE